MSQFQTSCEVETIYVVRITAICNTLSHPPKKKLGRSTIFLILDNLKIVPHDGTPHTKEVVGL